MIYTICWAPLEKEVIQILIVEATVRFEEPQGTPGILNELGYNDQTWDLPWNQARGQLTSGERMPSYIFEPVGKADALDRGTELDVESLTVMDPLSQQPMLFEEFLNRRVNSDALLISHRGKVVYEKYFNGMRESDQHLCHSCTKTLTTMQIGIAIQDGLLDPKRFVYEFVPDLAGIAAWADVTVQHVLDMATGIKSDEHYEHSDSMYYTYARGVGYWGPDTNLGVLKFVEENLTTKECEPGTLFNYASYNTNLFPLILEAVYGIPAAQLYEEKLYRKIRPEFPALLNTDAFKSPIVEGHLNLSLRDFHRWGHLLANGGRNLQGEQVIPEEWVTESVRRDSSLDEAFARSEYAELFPGGSYHNQLWRPDAEGGVCTMLGIYGQFYYIDLVNEIEIVGFSSYPELSSALMAVQMQELWRTVTEALNSR